MMGPDSERSSTHGLAIVACLRQQRRIVQKKKEEEKKKKQQHQDLLMPSIPYHKPNIVFRCKSNSLCDIRRLLNVDCMLVVIPQRAGNGSRGESVAAFVCEIRRHDR